MKYEPYRSSDEQKRKKLYLALAGCVLAIGAITFFAVSQAGKKEEVSPLPDVSQNEISSDFPSYLNSSEEYNNNANSSVPEQSSAVNQATSSVPYQAEESKPQKNDGFILPVEGKICKNFSADALQFSATYGDMRLHEGVDFACPEKTAIKAVGNGTVLSTEESGSLGKTVTVDHGNGITVKYCGFSAVQVTNGSQVTCGQPLGSSGTIPCECADTPHIHLEVYQNGKVVAPLKTLGLQESTQ